MTSGLVGDPCKSRVQKSFPELVEERGSQDLVQPGTVEGSLAGRAGEGSLDLTRLQGADVLLTVSLATSDQVPERRGGQGRVKRTTTHGTRCGGGTALREKVDRSQSLF